LPWECEGSLPHAPSHLPTLPRVCDVIPGLLFALTPGLPLALTTGLPLGPQHYNPFALVMSPKLGLRHNQTTWLGWKWRHHELVVVVVQGRVLSIVPLKGKWRKMYKGLMLNLVM